MKILVDDLLAVLAPPEAARVDKRAPVVLVSARDGSEVGAVRSVAYRGGELRVEVEIDGGLLCDGSGACVL